MDPLEVAALIEGLPYISAVPVEPGLTNAVHFQNGQRLVGFNTENQELNGMKAWCVLTLYFMCG